MIFEEQLSLKPNHYPWTEDFIDAIDAGHWTDREFNFSSDVQDFKVNLEEKDRQAIIKTLSSIGQVEISLKLFWSQLGQNLPHPSLMDLGFKISATEVTHGLAYSRLLTVLGIDEIFEENLKLPFIKGRVTYLRKYTKKEYKDSKKQYLYALILFTLFVENVSLFSQFYVINWFHRHKNVLKSVTQQTDYSMLEENLHAMVGVKVINTIREEYPELFDAELEEKVLHEAEEAFKAESKIIDWILADINEDSLNTELLKEFIKNRINNSLKDIGFHKCFEVNSEEIKKTRWFDEDLLGNSSTDFFAKSPVDYSRKSQSFDTDDLF